VSDVDFGTWSESRGRHFILSPPLSSPRESVECRIDIQELAVETGAVGLSAIAAVLWSRHFDERPNKEIQRPKPDPE
jgi:hypothetical protein